MKENIKINKDVSAFFFCSELEIFYFLMGYDDNKK